MNERIKQFADQCRGDPMTSAFEPRFDKEKFAELVEAAARADQREKCAKLVVNLFDPADSVAEFIAEKILATGVEA